MTYKNVRSVFVIFMTIERELDGIDIHGIFTSFERKYLRFSAGFLIRSELLLIRAVWRRAFA